VASGSSFVAVGVAAVLGFFGFVVAFLLLWDALEPGTGETGLGGQVAAVVVLALAFLASWGLFNLIGGVRRWRGGVGTVATWAAGIVALIVATVLQG